jgi:hypothetical protein
MKMKARLQLSALDDFCCLLSGGCNRHDLVVITLDDEGRLVDLFEIGGIVHFSEFVNALVFALDVALAAPSFAAPSSCRVFSPREFWCSPLDNKHAHEQLMRAMDRLALLSRLSSRSRYQR